MQRRELAKLCQTIAAVRYIERFVDACLFLRRMRYSAASRLR